MEQLVDTGKAGVYVELGKSDPEIAKRQKKGEAAFDAAKWSAFLAFDIVGDLVSVERHLISGGVANDDID